MQTETILLIIAAFIISLIVSLYQYLYKAKSTTKKSVFFAFLRFLSVFAILLLLINPSFRKKTFFTEKPKLIVAIDNSSSIAYLKQEQGVVSFVERIKNSKEINDRFDINYYSFSDDLKDSLQLSFDQKQTNISRTLEDLSQIYKSSTAPTILLTDGNQTYGKDYQYSSSRYKQQVYPVIVGDTIMVTDTKVAQLNVNRYAYLKNKFPVEAILTYSGDQSVSSRFQVSLGNAVVFSQNITFTEEENSKVLNFTLPATQVGVVQYNARLIPLENEKNKVNNVQSLCG